MVQVRSGREGWVGENSGYSLAVDRQAGGLIGRQADGLLYGRQAGRLGCR